MVVCLVNEKSVQVIIFKKESALSNIHELNSIIFEELKDLVRDRQKSSKKGFLLNLSLYINIYIYHYYYYYYSYYILPKTAYMIFYKLKTLSTVFWNFPFVTNFFCLTKSRVEKKDISIQIYFSLLTLSSYFFFIFYYYSF